MKSTIKFFGIIAIIAIIGFSMMACGGSGSPANNIFDPMGTWHFSVYGDTINLTIQSNTWAMPSVMEGPAIISRTFRQSGNTLTFYLGITGETEEFHVVTAILTSSSTMTITRFFSEMENELLEVNWFGTKQ